MTGEQTGSLRARAGAAGFALLILTFSPTASSSSPSALADALAARFPAIRSRLDSPVRFESASWRQGTRTIDGLRTLLPPPSPAAAASRVEEPGTAPAVVDRVSVSLPALASDAVVAEGERVRVALAPSGARAARAEIAGATVAYRDVYPDTDALHVAKPGWTEEYLYLRSLRAPRRFEYAIVEASGATRVFLENGQVHFLGDDGKGLVVLAPVVVDAIGRRSATAARWSLGETADGGRRLTLSLDPAGLEYPLLVDPTWITTGGLSTARGDGMGILLHNGRVLVLGNAATAELYDPATGTWSPTGAGWASRGFAAAAMLRSGRVLACGGVNGPTFAECRKYDPDTNGWTLVASMGTPRQQLTLTLLNDGRVLATGGQVALNTPIATAEIYDPAGDTWTPTGSLSAPKARHTATLLRDGRVLAAGGTTLPGPSGTRNSEIYDPATGLWTRVGDTVVTHYDFMATLLPDGRVLAAGGSFENRAELFDPGAGTWSATNALSVQRSEASATLLPQGRVLVAGGGSGGIKNTTELYDYTTGIWTAGPAMTFARYRHASTMLPDGRVLVAGGFNGPVIATAELLDADAPFWAAANPMGTARPGPKATVLKSGKVLLTGGAAGINTAEVYDPATASFSPTANNLTDGRGQFTATALVNGQVLIAGGTGIATGSADLYDPTSNSFTATGAMSGPRYQHSATLLPCGEVLVAGGEYGSPLATAERYNPRTGRWRPTGPLNQARWRHTATLLKDGRVLVTGGFGAGTLATAEIYDPATESWTLTAGSMAFGRVRHTATLLPSGKVLVSGGSSAGLNAQLFDPATGLFTNTGATTFVHDEDATATLLPNGRVLAVGGFANQRKAEVYDPGQGVFTAVPDTLANRDLHAAALLPDGRVLLAGGIAGASAEIYDVGRGELAGWRPILATATDPLVAGTPLAATGVSFRGLGEGASGLGYMQSATNYPLVQLRRLDNELVSWLPVDPASGWSATDFRSLALSGVAPGLAIATVFTNGIPSLSKGLAVECPAPTISTPPASQSACQGTPSVSFVASLTGSQCPALQWRKDGVPLTDGAPYTGTATTFLTIAPAGLGEAGSYDLQVALACSSAVVTSPAATLSVNPAIGAVAASISGPAGVCTTCLGGTASESHTGGGSVTHQWGYRTTSGGPITDIPFATSPGYVLSGADFPGVGNYFLVVKLDAACGGLAISSEVPVTVANTAAPADEVPFFTVTSHDSRNVLEWVYPAAHNKIRIRYATGLPCAFPTDGDTSGSFLVDQVGSAGARDSFAHDPAVNGTTYCYTLFVDTTGGGVWSTGRTNSASPFATSGPVKWAFHSGMFSLTAPTVGAVGVIATNNDNAVHAMTRGTGASGGEWPPGWKPVVLGGAVQNRSPIVPITVGGSNPVVFLGAQDGNVYAVDGTTGGAAASPWPGPAAAGGRVQAAPAGLFTAFGGSFDYLLVGTREASANNVFRAFSPANGSLLASFDNGGGASGIGMISSMAAVDYAASPNRVYFTSHARAGGSPNTLWCLELLATPGVFNLLWARSDLGDIESGPVLRGGRLYVGSTNAGGTLYSIDAASGNPLNDRSYVYGDGPVKGFVFPDRSSPTGDLYFAADTRVWGVTEIGATLANKYGAGIPLPFGAVPSTLLFQPTSHYLYVGGSDGWLYQIDTLAASPSADYAAQLGAAPLTIGAPSLDIGYGLLHVGSEPGTFFAVQVPVAPANLCTASCLGKPAGLACTTSGPPCTKACDGAGNCF